MPVERCQIDGQPGYRWGQQGKCYIGPDGRSKAAKQGRAIKAQGTYNAKHPGSYRSVPVMGNPLLVDPTRTLTLRRKFMAAMGKRFAALKRKINKLVVEEDAFGLKRKTINPLIVMAAGGGLTINQRWRFLTDRAKIDEFRLWLNTEMASVVSTDIGAIEDAWFTAYTEEGYRKGAGRAFDDVRKPALASGRQLDFYTGTRAEFLRQSFARPVAIAKVKLLAGRVFTELRGVTQTMGQQITRELTDGLVQGQNPRRIARSMSDRVDIGRKRADVIARTEIIRSHAEGQLDALEDLDVVDIGVMVEWQTSPDQRLCKLCRPLQGTVMKVDEARGLIPRHPNCRCAFIPANVGEPEQEQQRTKAQVQRSIDESIKAEIPTKQVGKRTLAQQKERSRWEGADKNIAKKRPEPLIRPRRRVARKRGRPRLERPTPGGVPKEWLDSLTDIERKEFRTLVAERVKLNKAIKKAKQLGIDPNILSGGHTVTRVEEVKARIKEIRRMMKARAELPPSLRPWDKPKVPKPKPKPKPKGHPSRWEIPEPQIGPIEKRLAEHKYLDNLVDEITALYDPARKSRLQMAVNRAGTDIVLADEAYWKAKGDFLTKYRNAARGQGTVDYHAANLKWDDSDIGKNLHAKKQAAKEVEVQAIAERNTYTKKQAEKAHDLLEIAEKERMRIRTTRATTTHKDYGGTTVMHTNPQDHIFIKKMKEAEDWLTRMTRRHGRGFSELNNVRQTIKDYKVTIAKIEQDLAVLRRQHGSVRVVQHRKELEDQLKIYKSKLRETVAEELNLVGTAGDLNEIHVVSHRVPKNVRAWQRFKKNSTLSRPAGVYLEIDDGVSTFIHELMHRYEEDISGLLDLSKEFLDMRIARSGKPVVNLKKKFSNYSFKPYEEGSPDDFEKIYNLARAAGGQSASVSAHYVGKIYSDATEIMTMGIELMFNNPVEFAIADPEYFKFIQGVLRGTL